MKLHQKQSQAIQSNKRFKILNWGRRCFTADTPITLSNGKQKKISDINIGDIVVSLNEKTNLPENKRVLNIYKYGVDYCPKPMIQLSIYGKTITSTYDHEYRINNKWIPAYVFAWGSMETRERKKLKLFCKQYGQTFNDPKKWWKENSCDETSYKHLWLFKNSGRWKDGKNSPINSRNIYTKSTKQTLCESYRQQSIKQQSGEFRMGNTKGKYESLQETRKISTKIWRKLWNSFTKRISSKRNTGDRKEFKEIKTSIIERIITILLYKSRFNQGYFEKKDLEISRVKVLKCLESFDLEVEDNHNYIAHDIVVHNSGKTTLIAYEALITLYNIDNALVSYYAPTASDARDIAWEIFKQTFDKLIIKTNEVLLEMTVKNKFGGTSILRLAGWEAVKNRDKGRGVENDLVILDECAFYPNFKELFEKVIEPTVLTSKGKIIFTSTPNGFNHFYDLYNMAMNNEMYFVSHATSYDNEANDPEELTRLRKEKDQDVFAQEYMADFRKVQGLVYKDFDREKHTYDGATATINKKQEIVGIDWGFVHPLVMLRIFIDQDGTFFIDEEFYHTGKTTEEAIDYLGSWKPSYVYPDCAEADRVHMLKQAGYYVKDVNKDIKSGIDRVISLIRNNRLYINKRCVNTISEIESYCYDVKGNKENPVKENDDAMDAMRYALFMHQPAQTREKNFAIRTPDNRTYKNKAL